MAYGACNSCGCAHEECECGDILYMTVGELDARIRYIQEALEANRNDLTALYSLKNLAKRIGLSGGGPLVEHLRARVQGFLDSLP